MARESVVTSSSRRSRWPSASSATTPAAASTRRPAAGRSPAPASARRRARRARPEPASDRPRWTVTLSERELLRLTWSSTSAANGRSRDQAGSAAGLREVQVDDLGPGRAARPAAGPQRLLAPGRGRLGEIEVAIDPAGDPGASQRLEASVELAAGGAEVGVGAVAQRQDGEAHLIEAGRVLGHQGTVEATRRARAARPRPRWRRPAAGSSPWPPRPGCCRPRPSASP